MFMSKQVVEVSITHLERYPLKAAGGISEQAIRLSQEGFVSDRNWMIVDSQGNFQSQRNRPNLARLQALHSMTKDLHIRDLDTGNEFSINKLRNGEDISVKLHQRFIKAIDCGDKAADWLEQTIGVDSFGGRFRLVEPKSEYSTAPASPEETNFADAHPFLLCSEESLAALNQALTEKQLPAVPMNRFRPNIVISGVDALMAFAEYEFKEMISLDGNKHFKIESPCKRCTVTTVDQATGTVRDRSEPLRTLATLNNTQESGAFFGANMSLVLGAKEEIRVGEKFFLI